MSDKRKPFTPFAYEGTRIRAHMEISEGDERAFDDIPKDSDAVIVIHDFVSCADYSVKRCDCGAGCRCAAVIVQSPQFTNEQRHTN